MSYSTIKFGGNLIKNKTCTITYSGTLFQNNSEFVNIVYGFGNEWHHTKEQEMERTEDGFVVEVNMLEYDTFNFCFRNSNYEWDNNNNQNYTSPISEEAQEEINFIINDDTVITNIMTNLCEIDVSNASDKKVSYQTAETLENVEVASIAGEGTPFDIEIETNIPVNIEDSLVNITEAEGLDKDIENLFTDIYQKATSGEQVADQLDFDMNTLIDEILSPVVQSALFEDEEETTLFEEVDDSNEDYSLDSKIDDLITDLFNNTRAFAADKKTEQEQNYDIEIDKAIDSRIDEILSETPIIKFEETNVETSTETPSIETTLDVDQVPEVTKAIITKKVPDFTVIDEEEESLIENIATDTENTNENTSLIEVDTDKKFVVSPRALGKFYMFKKKVKLAFTKLFVTLPKLLAKGYDSENN